MCRSRCRPSAAAPCRRQRIYLTFTFSLYANFFIVKFIWITRVFHGAKTTIPAQASEAPLDCDAIRTAEARTRPADTHNGNEDFAGDELSSLVVRGCLIARDAVFNVRDFLAGGSRLALLAIKDCEKELDQIERKIDDELPEAITRVGEAKARELLACLKFITDLERIGDLAYNAAMHLESRREKLPAADSRQLAEMASLLCAMLEQVHQGFLKREVAHAQSVLQSDPEVDRLYRSLFQRHLAEPNNPSGQKNFAVLLAAQALERIGDHAKNLAEEIHGLSEGRSLRHNARKLSTA